MVTGFRRTLHGKPLIAIKPMLDHASRREQHPALSPASGVYFLLGNKMTWLTDILTLVEKIPASFWGVVVGSFLSLGGVVVSNRANDRRLRQQLAHDRELKNRERELSLRKDIYLAAAEAIATGLNSIGSFANLDISNDKLTAAYVDKSPSIAMVHIIAKTDTTKAVAKLVGELEAAYLRLFARRLPQLAEKQQIAFIKNQTDAFGRERDRMLELMKQYNLSGENDPRKWEILEENFNFEQKRIDNAVEEHDRLASYMYSKQIDLMSECINETTKLSRLIAPVLTAVRTELEMPFDEASYVAVIEENILHQKSVVAEFIKQIQTSVVAQQDAPGDAVG